jgi:hypothetical protein
MMAPICYTETSVTTNKPTQRNTREKKLVFTSEYVIFPVQDENYVFTVICDSCDNGTSYLPPRYKLMLLVLKIPLGTELEKIIRG